jgi:hypothetical protein
LRTRGMLVVALLTTAAVVAPESPVHADVPQPWALRTIAGGPGQGTATSVAARPDAISFRPDGSLLVLADKVLRSVDLRTGTATIVAGTGLDDPLTEQTHSPDGRVGGRPGPAALASIGPAHHLAVRPDGSAVLSGESPVGWATYELSSTDRIRPAQCCSEYQNEAIPDGAGGYYYTDGNAAIRHRAADGSDVLFAGGSYDYGGACPVGPALSTPLDTLNFAQIALNPAGELVLAEPECVVRYDAATGALVRIAGSDSGTGSTGDGGPAVAAHLDQVRGIAYDAAGDLFLATGPEVREVTPDGTISTVAGSGTTLTGYNGMPQGTAPRTSAAIGDGGPAIDASMNATGVAVDGNRLAIIDQADNRVRLVSPIAPSATITTVFGDGWAGFDRYDVGAPAGHSLDGPALDAQLAPNDGEATAPDGTRYVATAWSTIAAIGTDGAVHTVAGTGVVGDSPDGATAATSALYEPASVTVGPDGTVYFVDHHARIRAITAAGTLTTLVGGGTDASDGVAAATAGIYPVGRLAVDVPGRIYWSDQYFGSSSGPRVRMWDPSSGLVTTIAGGGSSTSDGLALGAALTSPTGAALTADGRVLFTDGERVRAVAGGGTPSAAIVTIAGVSGHTSCTALPGGSGSIATQTYLTRAGDVVTATNGDVFFVDGAALDRIDAQGQLTTVAGQRCYGHPGPFDAVGNDRASFYSPLWTGLDIDGEPLVVDRVAGRIYRATPDHVLPAPTITDVHASSTQLQVTWSATDVPADSSGVRTYTVDAEPGHHEYVVYATTTQVTLRGLDNGQSYSMTVTAQNTAGDSAASTPVQGTPGASPPSPPRQLWVDPIAGGLVVHFQRPLNDGGSPITSYVATASPGNVTVTVSGSAESATIRGLATRGYSVTVSAANAGGTGAAASTTGTPDAVPSLARVVVTAPRTRIGLSRAAGIRDVDTADVVLTDAHGHRVGVGLLCLSGSGARVACDQQVVVRIIVTPTSALQSRALYRLTVNPSGDPNPITDLGGNAVPRFTMSFRAGSSG